MSLLKLRKVVDTKKVTLATSKLEFQGALDAYIKEPTIEAYKALVNIYSNYSYVYLLKISKTLLPIKDAKDEMIFMNSILVEVGNELGLNYFHPEHSYSVIDKTVAYVIANGTQDTTDYIQIVLDGIKEAVDAMNEDTIDVDIVEKA